MMCVNVFGVFSVFITNVVLCFGYIEGSIIVFKRFLYGSTRIVFGFAGNF